VFSSGTSNQAWEFLKIFRPRPAVAANVLAVGRLDKSRG